MSPRDWASIPTVGSSRKRSRGECTIPAARLRRRFMPPEKVDTFWSAFSESPTAVRAVQFRFEVLAVEALEAGEKRRGFPRR